MDTKRRHYKKYYDEKLKRVVYQSDNYLCSLMNTTCEYCESYTSTPENMPSHYERCPSFPVLCPHACTMSKFKRADLVSHLESMCPQHTIRCEYHDVGCDAHMTHNEVQHHMEKNVKENLSLISRQITATGSGADPKCIDYMYVSNLPQSCQKQTIESCFGKIGTVAAVQMIPFRSAAIVEFHDKGSYASALWQSHRFGISLLQHSLRVTPIYSSSLN